MIHDSMKHACRGAVLFVLSFTAVPAHSETVPASRPVSRQELAQKLRLYESIRVLEVAFTQTKLLKDLDVRLVSEGRFKITRPDTIVWEITKPSPVRVLFDKKEIRMTSGAGASAQTQVLKLGESLPDKAAKSMTSLVAWLNLDAASLSSRYVIHSLGKQAFRFEPREKEGTPFQDLEMTLAENGHLKRLLIHEISGDSLDIAFGKPKITPAPARP